MCIIHVLFFVTFLSCLLVDFKTDYVIVTYTQNTTYATNTRFSFLGWDRSTRRLNYKEIEYIIL